MIFSSGSSDNEIQYTQRFIHLNSHTKEENTFIYDFALLSNDFDNNEWHSMKLEMWMKNNPNSNQQHAHRVYCWQ